MTTPSNNDTPSDLFGKGQWTHQAVPPGCACPECKEWCMDLLVWIGDDEVRCDSCLAIYNPGTREVHRHDTEPIDLVAPEGACLRCGQRDCDALVWIDDECVQCQGCQTVYRPGGPRDDHIDSTR